MRCFSCVLVLFQLLFAIEQGRPMGDAPELYYTYNGDVVPQKIVRVGIRKDSLYDTLFIENLGYDKGLMGICKRTPFENGEPSEYLYYYDSLERIDMTRINVLDNDAVQPYALYSYGYFKRPDTSVVDTGIITDSTSIHSIEQKIAMIPGYPLKKYKKTESYIRVGDSTDTSVTITTDLYRWLSGSQGGGSYRHISIQKMIQMDGRHVVVCFPPNGGDTLFIDKIFNDVGDTLSEEATLLKKDGTRQGKYRVSFTYERNNTEKKVEVYDSVADSWRDSVSYSQIAHDGAVTIEELRYDSTFKKLVNHSREIHKTLANPQIAYYEYQSEGDSAVLVAEDFILYDTTIVALLEESVEKSHKSSWNIGPREICLLHRERPLQATLLTLTGRVIRQMRSVTVSNGQAFSIAGLPQGVYVLSVMGLDKKATTLFRVQ